MYSMLQQHWARRVRFLHLVHSETKGQSGQLEATQLHQFYVYIYVQQFRSAFSVGALVQQFSPAFSPVHLKVVCPNTF